MVWYFNFCSPHLNDDEIVNVNRTLMVIELVIAMFVTFVVHMLAELYDEESNRGIDLYTQSKTKQILLRIQTIRTWRRVHSRNQPPLSGKHPKIWMMASTLKK